MIGYLYGWIRGIAYYMVLVTAVMQVTASESYRKYIRLFTGIILVLMILAPVTQFLEAGEKELGSLGTEYEKITENIQEKVEEMEQENMPELKEGYEEGGTEEAETGGVSKEQAEEKEAGRIEVEEIRIGR